MTSDNADRVQPDEAERFPVQLFLPWGPLPDNDEEWRRVQRAAERLSWRLTVVIGAPHNGLPALSQTEAYVRRIDSVRRHGGRVYGYVHTCKANTVKNDLLSCPIPSLDYVLGEVDQWDSRFGGRLRGVFVSEVSTDAGEATIDFYRRLARHISTKKGPPPPGSVKPYMYDCILDYWGVPTREAYQAMRNPPATGCYVVRSEFRAKDWKVFDPPDWLSTIDSTRKIALDGNANAGNWRDSLQMLTEHGFNSVNAGNSYESWFDEQVDMIAGMDDM